MTREQLGESILLALRWTFFVMFWQTELIPVLRVLVLIAQGKDGAL